MAISCNVLLPSNIALAAAYIRIDGVGGNREHFNCSATIHVDQEARAANLPVAGRHEFKFVPDISPDAPQIFAQAYAALKADPTFADAVDV